MDWKNFCRDIYFLRKPGGPGHTVKIDECLLVTSAQEVQCIGHQVGEQWVFGGYDVVDKGGFIVPVDRRDAATLLPVIRQHIVPGNYNNFGSLGCLQYARHARLPASYSQPHFQLI